MTDGAITACPFCAKPNRAGASTCWSCNRDLSEKLIGVPVAAPAKKPMHPLAIIGLVVAGAVSLLLFSGVLFRGVRTVAPPPVRTTAHQIVYRVSGSAAFASMTYTNAQGGTEQTEKQLPWEVAFSAQAGAFLYLSAQNSMQLGGVTCAILVDGVVAKTSTSEGGYKIASCSGRL
jgi:hypothetical protein